MRRKSPRPPQPRSRAEEDLLRRADAAFRDELAAEAGEYVAGRTAGLRRWHALTDPLQRPLLAAPDDVARDELDPAPAPRRRAGRREN